MRHSILLAVALVLSTQGASADRISVYADPYGYTCTLYELNPFPDLNTLYVIHKENPGSTGSQFKVLDNSGLFFVTATFPPSYLVLGGWNVGYQIAYADCVVGDHVVVTANFFWFDNPMSCANYLRVDPFPNDQTIFVYQCDYETRRPGYGCYAYVGVHELECNDPHCDCVHPPLPVREVTWGSVKALYR